MIFFIYGDNQVASRGKLTDLISEAQATQKEIIRLEGKTIDQNKLLQTLESDSLFGQEKMVIIENLFIRQKSKEKDSLIQYLKKEPIKPGVIFWEPKEISGTTIRWLPKTWQFLVFKTPVIIFKLLDSLRPGNQTQILPLMKESISGESSEMVFYMIARRIKELIIAKDMGKTGLNGAPWQIGKLIYQAKNFTLDQLKSIYLKLLEIDIDIKTGRGLMPLDWYLDLLIVNM
ncbi:MAG TPA: hypothetical protein VMW29_01445 [Candidatus Bathyarchaeia archaeon]|nr:hypothetical protein [Candidatus Bathyarchaeia archaeon]